MIDLMVLKNVNVIDVVNSTILMDYSIMCSNGRIVKVEKSLDMDVPKNARILDLKGKYVIPGLIDAHVHLSLPGVDDYTGTHFKSMSKRFIRNSYLTICSGVTAVREMPGNAYGALKIRNKINNGKIVGPRILVSSPALSAPYGYFSLKRFIPAPPMIVIIIKNLLGIKGVSIDIETESQISDVIEKMKKQGFDFIKTVTPGTEKDGLKLNQNTTQNGNYIVENTDVGMQVDILKLIADNTHKNNLKVSAHNICLPDGFSRAVKVGIDSIEHTPLGLINDETFDYMSKKGTYWVPTAFAFINWKRFVDNPDTYDSDEIKKAVPEPYYSKGKKILMSIHDNINSETADLLWAYFYKQMERYQSDYLPTNLSNAIKHKIKIVAGTDAGAGGAGYVPHGFFYKELETLNQFGMTEYEVLKSATINAAELLGMNKDIGSIESGKFADMVVLDDNPINNISNIQNIAYVIKENKILYSAK